MRIAHILAAALTVCSAYGAEPTDSTGTALKLEEVTVTGQSASRRVTGTRIGVEHLDMKQLAKIPVIFGERDIIKSLTLLPGVRAESDASGGFEVRGGTAWQNHIRLDEITMYNPSHTGGIFSTFNDDALSRATLYKGPVPAAYGSAVASALDIGLKEGEPDRFHASGTVGILAAKAYASGPIIKDKLTFAASARRSYVDLFLNLIPQYRNTIMHFYDLTAKLQYTPAVNHTVEGSFYFGRDNMSVKEVMGMRWGNLGASINWKTNMGETWRMHTTAALTHYTSDMDMSLSDTESSMREFIRNYSINEKITAKLNEKHYLEFGLRSELLRVMSGEMTYAGMTEREIRSGWQNALWVEYSGRFGRVFSLIAGVRGSLFSAISSPKFNEFVSLSGTTADMSPKHYFDAEPRAGLKFAINENHSIKAGMFMATQNIHALRASSTSFPFDRFALSSAAVKPEKSVQYSLGYNGMTGSGSWDWQAEIYYKEMTNVYDFRDGASMFSEISLEELMAGGRGRSYGMELMMRKNTGRLTGWASYTLSRSQTRIPGINNGRWYNASNERRHDFNIVAIYNITKAWSVSAQWIYASGHPLTAPDVKYQIDGATCYYYSGRNTYKTPPTHRLDLSATYTHTGKKLTYQWAFGLYNAYNRMNPFAVYFEEAPEHPAGTRAVQQSLYGILPSVSYTLTF